MRTIVVFLTALLLSSCGVAAIHRDSTVKFDPKTREGAACKVRCAENDQIGSSSPGSYARCIDACKDLDRFAR